MEYFYQDGVRLVLSYGSIFAPPDRLALLLDLDIIWEQSDSVQRDVALKIANDLRDRERIAFEAVITDKARDLFDAS